MAKATRPPEADRIRQKPANRLDRDAEELDPFPMAHKNGGPSEKGCFLDSHYTATEWKINE
jgi:hypothetical protein